MALAASRERANEAIDLDAMNELLESLSPQEILRWASDTFGASLCLQSSMQRRTSALVHMLGSEGLQHVPVLFVDTGFHFAETLALRDELASRYGLHMVTLRSEIDPESQRAFFGRDLYASPDDYKLCCELRKVRPFLQAARQYDAVISGLQRAQGGSRRAVEVVTWDPRIEAYKIHPLAAWSHAQVDAYNDAHDVPVNALHALGYPSIGCEPCTTPVAPGEPERAGRWRHIRELLEAAETGADGELYCEINWVDRAAPGQGA